MFWGRRKVGVVSWRRNIAATPATTATCGPEGPFSLHGHRHLVTPAAVNAKRPRQRWNRFVSAEHSGKAVWAPPRPWAEPRPQEESGAPGTSSCVLLAFLQVNCLNVSVFNLWKVTVQRCKCFFIGENSGLLFCPPFSSPNNQIFFVF